MIAIIVIGICIGERQQSSPECENDSNEECGNGGGSRRDVTWCNQAFQTDYLFVDVFIWMQLAVCLAIIWGRGDAISWKRAGGAAASAVAAPTKGCCGRERFVLRGASGLSVSKAYSRYCTFSSSSSSSWKWSIPFDSWRFRVANFGTRKFLGGKESSPQISTLSESYVTKLVHLN